ncbi:MAG TPA: VCBS repeat-containing protein [Candidatus Polarisedimenticolaceae bacterium]|nr:VCBS repeat-containing protein [Candidatus Polarisedimenticolaceae bacterium]
MGHRKKWSLAFGIVVLLNARSRAGSLDAPTNLVASGAFTGAAAASVILTWNDTATGDAGFVVEGSSDGGHSWSPFSYTPENYIKLHSGSNSEAIGGGMNLPPGATLLFRVAATHPTLGQSAYSNEVSVTMPAFPTCSDSFALSPAPHMKAHVGFPLDLTENINRPDSCYAGNSYCVQSGPTGLGIDFSGGLVTWTPTQTQTGTFTVTLGFGIGDGAHHCTSTVATTTFDVDVDPMATLTQPLFRDYRSETQQVLLNGSYMPDGFAFGTYQFFSAPLCVASGANVPDMVVSPLSTGTIISPPPLATWDISSLPNGSRRVLTMITQTHAGANAGFYDPVIIDRSSYNTSWPKRLPLGSPRGALAVNLDVDNSSAEIIANSRDPMAGGPYCWELTGALRWQAAGANELTNSEVAVGNVDGSGKDDVVTVSVHHLRVLDGNNGTVVANADVTYPSTFLSGASLGDLNGDGLMEILVNVGDGTNAASTYVYKYDATAPGHLSLLSGWPKVLPSASANAPPAVADLNADGKPDIIVDNRTYLVIFKNSYPSFKVLQSALPANYDPSTHNVNGGAFLMAQPAVADLDANGGTPEIVVGAVVYDNNGALLRCLGDTACTQTNPLPNSHGFNAAIGEFDHSSNGLEVVLGQYVFAGPTGILLRTLPLLSNNPASIVDGGVDGAQQPRTYAVMGTGSDQCGAGITAYRSDGTVDTDDYPKALYGITGGGSIPQVGDFDGDGTEDALVEVTDSSYGAIVAVYRNQPEFTFNPDNNPWPMSGHDPQRTGNYACLQQRHACTSAGQCCSANCNSGTCR